MFQVKLLNMPFAALEFPSLALTQLASIVRRDHGDRASVQVLYANHEFARLAGCELFQEISTSVRLGLTGLGDWIFRRAAFPDQADNTKQYFARCFPGRDAATLRLQSEALRLRDAVEPWLDAFIERHALEQANVVGFTSMFAQNLACLALARKIKSRNPRTTVVMGGANCEFPMGREIVEHFPAVDFVFSGPALSSFSQFLRHQMDGEEAACHQISGVFSRQNLSADRGSTVSIEAATSSRPVVGIFGAELSVNELVPLDYDDFLESVSQFPQVQPGLLFETSRGCWWGERAHCTFCGLNGLTMKYRPMSAEAAIRQFECLFHYAERLPRLTLQCVDNIMPREYLQEVLPHLRVPANVDMFYEVKSDLTEQDVAALSAAHVRSIQPGIESLATSTLKLMKKGTTSFQGITLLKHCLRYQVVPQWNLLMGFPGETAAVYEKYQRDLPSLFHLPPPTGAFPVRFDRYSPYFSQAADYGLDLRPFDYYQLVYPFDDESLRRLAYFFIDNNFHADYFVDMVKWVSPISALVHEWRTRHAGADGRPVAELRLEQSDNGWQIADTRTGTRRVHPLNDRHRILLEALQKPLDRNRLAAVVGAKGLESLDQDIAFLDERRLLFAEAGRWLSVVLPDDQNSSSSSAARSDSARRDQRMVST